MPTKNIPNHVFDAFDIDGSLRDIHIHGTDMQDWQTLLTFLRAYQLDLIVDGERHTLPERAEDIFKLTQESAVTLFIDRGELELACHFFSEEEIELDIDPRDIQNEQRLLRLLEFISAVGELLGKEVTIAPESTPDYPWLRYSPRIRRIEWLLDP